MTIQTLDIQEAVNQSGLNAMLLVEYGSRAHGTAGADSDHDLLGVYVEADHELYGLDRPETQSYRIHGDGRLQRMGVSANETRSGNDIVEMSLHPLRKYVSLAAAGNPTVLSTLWSHEGLTAISSPAAELLTGARSHFLSKHAARRCAGYAREQRRALLGETNTRTNRPELIRVHGYDTKYAAHLIRLLLAGLDVVRDRTFHLPMKPEQVELLLEIRAGEYELEDLIALSTKLETELEDETDASDLPDEADRALINDLLREVRNEHLGR